MIIRDPIKSMEGAFCLKGKNAIVTGGNTGLGRGIAEAFAQQGANIAIMCRNQETGKQAVDELSAKYEGTFRLYKLDIRDLNNCKEAVAQAVKDFGNIDILVNNAGIAAGGPFLDFDDEMSSWFDCIDTDLNGAARMSFVVGKYMRDAGKGGKVINITSNSGAIINKPAAFPPYHAAKAGLNHLTRDLAVEWGKYGINVNAIAPGYTFSNLTKAMDAPTMQEMMEKMPAGRFGQAIEIGAISVFLASEASNMITGCVITADGGYSLAV